MKGNISIEAIVSKDHLFFKRDGYEVISPKEVVNKELDYIIVASSRYYREIVADAEKMRKDIKNY